MLQSSQERRFAVARVWLWLVGASRREPLHQKIQTHPRQTAKAPQATSVEECKKQVSSAWLLLMVSEANGVAIILWSQDLFISGHAAHREDYATASLAISGQNQSGASQRGKDVHFEWTRIQKTCLSELHLNDEGLRYSSNDITCIRQSCEIHWLVGGKRALPSDVASTNGPAKLVSILPPFQPETMRTLLR